MRKSGDNGKMKNKISSMNSLPEEEPIRFETRVFGSDVEALESHMRNKGKSGLFDPKKHILKVKEEKPRVVPFDLKDKNVNVKIKYPSIQMNEAIPKEYMGQPLAIVDWSSERGRPGLPWSRGTLRLEHHPDLHPILARGRGTDVGALWKLRAMPQVSDTVEPIIGIAKSAPWRIEPNEAASGANPDPVALQQHEWCLRSWREWTKSGHSYGWDRWVEDVLRFSLICGFYLGEISLDSIKDTVNLPMVRAPWTVDEWIMQNEKPIGVVQDFSDTATTFGSDTKTQVVLPWEKVLHVPFRPSGPSDLEGYSIIRPAYTPLTMLVDTYRIQGLSISINGMGTWKIMQNESRPFTMDEKEDLIEHFGNYEGGHVPWVIMPPGGDAILVTAQSGIVDLSSAIIALERAAAIALGSSHKLIALHQHGSFAARASGADEQRDQFDSFGKLISTSAQRLFVKAIKARFGYDGPCYAPKITHSAIEVRDNSARAMTMVSLVGAGLVNPHRSIERTFLEENDFPTDHLTEDVEVLERDRTETSK